MRGPHVQDVGSERRTEDGDQAAYSVLRPPSFEGNGSSAHALSAYGTTPLRFRRHARSSPMSEIDTPAVRAPDFPATLDWIHTGGQRLTLGDFRGRLLFLDFWTYG